MKPRILLLCCLAAASGPLLAGDPLDRVEDSLAAGAFHDTVRAQLSGALDLEEYYRQSPAPGLILAEKDTLFNPRLSLFLDAQLGSKIYAFAVWRLDRGFDPGDEGTQSRLDECAVRITPWDDGRLNLQIGKFATVVGNWVSRHNAWDNPFVTAPLPYENLTGIWDVEAVRSGNILLAWANLGPRPAPAGGVLDDTRSVPIIWGPSYTSGASVFGKAGKIVYAAELKNASLSSRPQAWNPTQTQWQQPAPGGRIGLQPDESWSFGVSASSGSYLRPSAAATIPPGRSLGGYREVVLGQDASFARHHWQLWAEVYEARFEIPQVGDARTIAYYAEAKVKLAPQLSGAVRWNQQLFSDIPLADGSPARWGRDVWRVDFAPGYRFTPHLQIKLQYSLQHEEETARRYGSLLAGQLTVRF
jgi:hypothetical protein